MSQKAGTKLRIDPDIERAVWVKLAESDVPLNRLVNTYLRNWLHGSSGKIPIAKPAEDVLQSLHAISRKLSAVKAELDGVIRRIDRRDDAGTEIDLVAETSRVEAELESIIEDAGKAEGGKGESGRIGAADDSRHRRKTSGVRQK